MNHINKLLIFMAAAASVGLTACSGDEEVLNPSPAEVNPFFIDASSNDPEDCIRREFYEETGIHLLFSDTITKKFDENGKFVGELMDFDWNFTSDGSGTYRYSYFESIDDKRAAAEMFKKHFVPYVNVDGGMFRPYSIILFAGIEEYTKKKWKPVTYQDCWRSFGVSAGPWLELEDGDIKETSLNLLMALIKTKLDTYSPELEDFFAVCAVDDGEYPWYVSDLIEDWEDEQDVTLIYEAGFLRYFPDTYEDDPAYDELPSDNTDMNDYIRLVLFSDEDTVNETWGDYEKIMLKYGIMKKTIADLGINLDI